MYAFIYSFYRIQFKCKFWKDSNICYEYFHHISVPEFMDAFFYGIYKFNLNVNCVKTINNIFYENFHQFLFQVSWMPSFTVFIEFNLNVNCVKTITFVLKIFIIFPFPSSLMPSFTVFLEFN